MPISEDDIGSSAAYYPPNHRMPKQPTVFESTNEATIRELFDLIKSLRTENAALVEQLLLARNPVEQEQKVEIPEHMEYIGKMPWYMRQQLLQKACKKPKLSEIAGIPDEGDQLDAG